MSGQEVLERMESPQEAVAQEERPIPQEETTQPRRPLLSVLETVGGFLAPLAGTVLLYLAGLLFGLGRLFLFYTPVIFLLLCLVVSIRWFIRGEKYRWFFIGVLASSSLSVVLAGVFLFFLQALFGGY